MNYVCYVESTGKIVQYLQLPESIQQSPIPGTLLLEIDAQPVESLDRYVVENSQLKVNAPIPEIASQSLIKNKWLSLEQEPLQLNGFSVDCDPLSELRMKGAIDNWDALPDIPGQMETIDGVRKITWSMPNTKVLLSHVELISVYDNMLVQRAVRAAILFNNYQRIKNMPNVSPAYVADTSNWTL